MKLAQLDKPSEQVEIIRIATSVCEILVEILNRKSLSADIPTEEIQTIVAESFGRLTKNALSGGLLNKVSVSSKQRASRGTCEGVQQEFNDTTSETQTTRTQHE